MGSEWDSLLREWARSMEGRAMSGRTIKLYRRAGMQLAHHLANHGGPGDATRLRREHIEAFLADFGVEHSPAIVSLTYRALQRFCAWLVDSDNLPVSPMAQVKPPVVPEQPAPILTDQRLRALLASCNGRDLGSSRHCDHPAADGHRRKTCRDRRS